MLNFKINNYLFQVYENMREIKTILIVGSIMFLTCWEKQDHKITAPKTPVYNFSGTIINSINNEPLDQVKVNLIGKVKYHDEDSSKIVNFEDITNDSGVFVFTEVPGANNYSLIAEKEDHNNGAHV